MKSVNHNYTKIMNDQVFLPLQRQLHFKIMFIFDNGNIHYIFDVHLILKYSDEYEVLIIESKLTVINLIISMFI